MLAGALAWLCVLNPALLDKGHRREHTKSQANNTLSPHMKPLMRLSIASPSTEHFPVLTHMLSPLAVLMPPLLLVGKSKGKSTQSW